MKIVLQRVTGGGVTIGSRERREIGPGLVMLIGVCPADNENIVKFMAAKAANLRIFGDENGAMNLSLLDTGGAVLAISNFTLYANCRKGRRPSFADAAAPVLAEPLYDLFVRELHALGIRDVKTGEFGADMKVEIMNDGPVAVILDSGEIIPENRIGSR